MNQNIQDILHARIVQLKVVQNVVYQNKKPTTFCFEATVCLEDKEWIKIELSKSDLKFIKTYHKKSYEKEQNLISDEFDINQKQAPLKTFNKINKEKNKNYQYSWKGQKNRMYDILNHLKVIELQGIVSEVNNFEDQLWELKY